jgi:hypothetical protein
MLVAGPVHAAPLDRYLPPKSQWVVGLNVRALLDSALFKKHGQERLKFQLKKDKQAEELSRFLGFDPYQDVNTIIVAGLGEDPLEFLAIVHGRFDLDKIQQVLEAVEQDDPKSVKSDIEKTVRYYELNFPEQPAPAFAAFLDIDTLIVSNKKEHVFHAIERSNDRKPAKLDKVLQTLIDRADAKKTIWLAAQVPETAKKKIAENPQVAGYAARLKYVAGYVTVTDSVQTEVQLQTTDPRSAEELRSLIETVRPFISKGIADNKDIGGIAGPIFDAIKVARVKNSLTFSSKIGAGQVDRVVKQLLK